MAHVSLVCVICGAGFTVRPYRRNTAKTCSVRCRQTYNARQQTGDSTRYRGAGKTYVKVRGRHMHRVIAEQKLGRALRPGEIVHHIDGNKRNNRPENLEVIPNQGVHINLHRPEMLRARKEKHGY